MSSSRPVGAVAASPREVSAWIVKARPSQENVHGWLLCTEGARPPASTTARTSVGVSTGWVDSFMVTSLRRWPCALDGLGGETLEKCVHGGLGHSGQSG